MNPTHIRQAISMLTPFSPPPAERTWDHHRMALREHMAIDDFENFLRWSTVEATMVVGDVDYVRKEIKELSMRRYRYALTEPGIGNPTLVMTDSVPPVITSPNLIHQTYHLYQWEATTEKKVEELKTIVEFGGGYGAMCSICRRLLFRGQYIIYDLPEFSMLQEYYLECQGYDATYFWVEGDSFSNSPKDVDLLIACLSLSEVSQNLRETFFYTVRPKSCLLVLQSAWNGRNVLAEFKSMAEGYPEYKWNFYPSRVYDGHHYAIGDIRS